MAIMEILKSASKIVFIMLAGTACVAFLWGKLPVSDFMLLTTGAFSFYFAAKPTDDSGRIIK